MRLDLYLSIRVFGGYFYKIIQILQAVCQGFDDYDDLVAVKGKGKVIPLTGHEDP
jgi:hypothetical protein